MKDEKDLEAEKILAEENLAPELDEELFKKKLFPVLIRPNIGNPEFICAKNLNIEEMEGQDISNMPALLDFEFEGLIAVCKKACMDDIIKSIDEKLFIYPLSEQVQNGRAIRLDKIPVMIKEFEALPIKDISDENYKGNPQIYLKTENAFPGRDIYYRAKFLFRAPIEIFYKSLDIGIELKSRSLRKMVICDIVYDLTDETVFTVESADDNYLKYYMKHQNGEDIPKNVMRINYHSLVLCSKPISKIDSMQFWHATDLHIAASNDEMPYVIFNKVKGTEMRQKDLEKSKAAMQRVQEYLMKNYTPDDVLKAINERLSDPDSFIFPVSSDETPYDISEADLPYSLDEFFWQLPIEYRAQNCNNNLRIFIYQANEAFKRGELDFIVFSGDLIDFVGPRGKYKHDFKASNWKVFMDIILGKPHKLNYGGLLPPEELMVPIFTVPGNHDYRGYSYPPTFANEMLGFTDEEIKLYPSSKLSYILSLRANIKYLRGYFQFINCDLNFAKKIGNTHLLFVDTDKDSFKDIYDLVFGSPSTKGLRDSQMIWLRNYCNKNVLDTDRVIIIMHSPLLNPPKIEISRDTLEKIFPELKKKEEETGQKLINIKLLKEYFLIDKFDDPRIDSLIDLKFGTIVKNWEEMLAFCLDCRNKGITKPVDLVLCGHAHKNLEFRIESLMGRELQKQPNLELFPFKKIPLPCAVYMGNYSLEYKAEIDYLNTLEKEKKEQRLANYNLITNKFPFILQTTALGPRSQREFSNLQAYRKITIKHNRIEGFETVPILRYFIPFEKIIALKSNH
ncbi:MAG: metallophosphoesterase family protein [Promethearchaeota archaeon]